jgi:hypothetical protein
VDTFAENDDQAQNVRRHCHKLSDVAGETQVCDNCRAEVREDVQIVYHQEVADRVHPEERVQECLLGNLHVEGLVLFVRRKEPMRATR